MGPPCKRRHDLNGRPEEAADGGNEKEDSQMKKLLIATAAVALAAGFAVPSIAAPAPAKSPYCKMANSQRNPVAWNAYYHCLDMTAAPAARPTRVAVRTRAVQEKSPYCKFASAQRNVVAWNAYYHCLSR
jgi:hypothetical protein